MKKRKLLGSSCCCQSCCCCASCGSEIALCCLVFHLSWRNSHLCRRHHWMLKWIHDGRLLMLLEWTSCCCWRRCWQTDPSFRVTLKTFLTILTQFGQPLHWSNMFYISIHFLFACLSKNHLYILIHCSPVSSTASRLAFRVIFPLYLSKILDKTFSYRLDLCFRIGYGSALFFFRIFWLLTDKLQ